MDDTPYILVQDDDAHWYVIPADKQDEWNTYVQAVTAYWDNDLEERGADDPEPTEPEWCAHVGGAPSLVKFRIWWIG